MTRFLAMGVLAFALTGCGTWKNFTEPGHGGTKPYGGVAIALERLEEPHLDVEVALLGRMPDVPLSALTDTLTLPLAIPIAFVYAVHDGVRECFFAKSGVMGSGTLPNWLQDSQPATPSPSVVPATP
ncbi:MAG: hypothetical protein K8U57_18895 [Planctomycetes bacterium]|nr:hypothetical protein [Planctomycetota bacterium]